MTQPLSTVWPQLSQRLRAGHPLLLFCDFDGTLVDIDDKPFEIYPSAEVKSALTALAHHPQSLVAVVSGRDLADLMPRVGVEGIAYAGNHGYEIHGPGFEFVEPTAVALRPELDAIVRHLEPIAGAVPGAWVQHKGFSASVHYRQTDPELVPGLTAAVEAVVSPHLERFLLKGGKMVWEVRPRVDWHKGRAVQWLTERFAVEHPHPIPVFLGDDVTDEDAFAMLPEGITVLVGPPRDTAAKYRVEEPRDVAAFLTWLNRELTVGEGI